MTLFRSSSTRRQRIVLALATALLATGWNGDGCVKATTTVIWVHGYDGPGGQSGIDLESQFGFAVDHFRRQGYTQRMYAVSYYDGDVSWTDNGDRLVSTMHLNAGGPGDCPHETHEDTGHTGGSGCFGLNAHTRGTKIEHLGYHLAWEIHNQFTDADKPVRIMAHSMGGLIVRYAMQQVKDGHPDFPDSLDIDSVATFGTPYDGGDLAFACHILPCDTQAEQMKRGSGFLNGLGDALPKGASLGNPDWWLYAAQDDDSVSVESALDPTGSYTHEYESGQAIEHSDYFDHTSTVSNYECFFRGSGPYDFCEGPMHSAQRRLSEKQCSLTSQCPGELLCLYGVCQEAIN